MPTAKPRVQVTLTRASYDSVSRVARARGVSRSHVIAELFEAARPALDRVAELIEVSKAAPKEVMQRFMQAADATERGMGDLFTSSLGQLDLLIHGIRDGKAWDSFSSEEEMRAQRALPLAAGDPRPVTRGSGNQRTHSKSSRRKPVSRRKTTKKGRR
jgi:hypothetical protein